MSDLFANEFNRNKLSVTQSTGKTTAKEIASLDHLLIVLPTRIPRTAWNAIPQGARFKRLFSRRRPGQLPAISGRLSNKRQTAVHIGQLPADATAHERQSFARKMLAATQSEKAGSAGIHVIGFRTDTANAVVGDMLLAAHALAFALPAFKSEKIPPAIRSIRLLGLESELDLARVSAEAAGNNLARWLTSLPPNKLDATEYAAILKQLASERGWQYKRFSTAELAKQNCGAFLAVAQGNADDSACMIRIRYRPGAKSSSPRLTLVGKGIIFDTGGNNLKPFAAMLDMHIDMGGSAAAVGTLLAIDELGLDVAVDCWLAVTENRIGPTAYKSQDVVTAANGKTIQAIHTDAEGRMALADTLVLACRDEPVALIDFATLTGACITAATSRYSGVFTNNPELQPMLRKAGVDSGERVWPFPMGKEFLEDLKSTTADLKQCSPDAAGDHILAATFLNEFVDAGINWIHVDLSAAQRKGGLGQVPTDITGFGVRYAIDLLLDKQLLEQPAFA